MPLGYKYAERTAPTEVDWYQVGKDMSDMLTETNRVREEKKDALAKAQRESLQALANTPNGQNESIRAAAIKYSNMATNNLKIQYDLMTRGQLDPKDWMIYRQNTLDGTDLIFNANKAYQENFKSIIEDNQNKIDSGLTLDNAKEVESIAGNWNSTDFNLSPNGTVIVSKLVEKEIDGKKVMVPSMEPGQSLSASSMNQLLLNRIPFPKTEDQIKSWVNNLGEEKKVIIDNAEYFKQGSVITISDIRSREDLDEDGKTKLFQFVQAENDIIDTFLGDKQNTASVLYDLKKFTGDNKPFQIVTDAKAAEKDPSLILKVYNKDTGMYDYKISDVQKKEAESWVRNQMRAQYNYEEKADVGGQLQKQYGPSSMYGGGGGKDKDKEPKGQIDQTPSIMVGKKIGDVKIQDNSKAFPIVNLTLGDSPSEKDINATSLIVSPGGKIYLEITKPNYIKTDFKDGENVKEGEEGEIQKSTKPITSLLDFGKDSKEIGRFARRLGMTTIELQNYAIQLVGDEFITTPDERRLQTTTGRSGKKIVKPK